MSHNTNTFILQPQLQLISSFNWFKRGPPFGAPPGSDADSHLCGGRVRGSLGPSGCAARQAGRQAAASRRERQTKAERRDGVPLSFLLHRRARALSSAPPLPRTAPHRAFTPHAAAQVSPLSRVSFKTPSTVNSLNINGFKSEWSS